MDNFYDEGICGLPSWLYDAHKVVQITVSVLYHILVNEENLTWTVVYFLFGRTLTKILTNGGRYVFKLLIILTGARLRNSCLAYFKLTALLNCISSNWSLN